MGWGNWDVPYCGVCSSKTRNSKNRPAGTFEPKCVNVNRYVYRDLMFNKVLPDINRKWRGDGYYSSA